MRNLVSETELDAALFPVWAWHWHDPAHSVIGAAGRRFVVPADVALVKAAALDCFVSQIEGPDPVLPEHFVDRFSTPTEVLVPL